MKCNGRHKQGPIIGFQAVINRAIRNSLSSDLTAPRKLKLYIPGFDPD